MINEGEERIRLQAKALKGYIPFLLPVRYKSRVESLITATG